MTTMTPPAQRRPEPSAPAKHRRSARAALRGGRISTIIVLIAGLVLSGVARVWSIHLQQDFARTGPYAGGVDTASGNGTTLGSMDSYLLALLLGGLRGPLVMFLWVSSESQKSERDLEDFDTKVELIRLLQPEFVTVHLFQMWNKAYNVSAQLASLPNKYAAILDAIRYGENVDASRPNDLNILLAIGGLYSQKFGESSEKQYYIKRVREDTKYRPPSDHPSDVPRHRVLLDERGNLLPELVNPTRPRPDNLKTTIFVPADDAEHFRAAAAKAGVTLPEPAPIVAYSGDPGDRIFTIDEPLAKRIQAVYDPQTPEATHYIQPNFDDGAPMQYLAPYQPYPYGVSPLAIGYDYAKRAQVLLVTSGQKPLQTTEGMVNSRPGPEMKAWSEETWQQAIQDEMKAFGRTSSWERPLMESPTAMLPLDDQPKDRSLAEAAVFFYDRSARLANDAIGEYQRQLAGTEDYMMRFQPAAEHLELLTAQWHLCRADSAYLRALLQGPGAARDDLLKQAARDYLEANTWYEYLDLHYNVPLQAYPRGFKREMLSALRRKSPEALDRLYWGVLAHLKDPHVVDENAEGREENRPYRERAAIRFGQASAALGLTGPAPTTHPSTEPTTLPTTLPVEPLLPATAPSAPDRLGPAGP